MLGPVLNKSWMQYFPNTAVVLLITFHFINHRSKKNKTFLALFEKKATFSNGFLRMNGAVFADKTSCIHHLGTDTGYFHEVQLEAMDVRDGLQESQGTLCYHYDLMMMMMMVLCIQIMHIYIYIYIYMCVCACVCVNAKTHFDIYTYIHKYIRIKNVYCIYSEIYIYIYIFIYIYVCVCVLMRSPLWHNVIASVRFLYVM